MAASQTLEEFLTLLVERGASDLHLKASQPPYMRSRGDLVPLEGLLPLSPEEVQKHLYSVLSEQQRKTLEEQKELDFSFLMQGLARFRGNAFYQRGALSAVFRAIPTKILSPGALGLPEVLKEIVSRPQGLILVTGPTGTGKSTTLAALVDHLNENFPKHIITIEDPIEFVYKDKKSLVNQREIGTDTRSFREALRRALRQDPDVILLGELRDAETISTAMTAAETGHLVMGTLHTNDAKQTIDRLLDSFPPDQQHQVRMQIAEALLAVISQRLLKRADGQGRVAVLEIMINSPTIKKLIQDNKIGAISKAIEDSASFYKMQSFNQALFSLIKEGKIAVEEALAASTNPNDLKIQLQTSGILSSGSGAPKAVESRPPPPGLKGF